MDKGLFSIINDSIRNSKVIKSLYALITGGSFLAGTVTTALADTPKKAAAKTRKAPGKKAKDPDKSQGNAAEKKIKQDPDEVPLEIIEPKEENTGEAKTGETKTGETKSQSNKGDKDHDSSSNGQFSLEW